MGEGAEMTNDSTIARMAGNIYGAVVARDPSKGAGFHVFESVRIARLIAAEVQRTQGQADAPNQFVENGDDPAPMPASKA